VYDIAIDPAGAKAVVAAQGGWLRVYDVATGTQLSAIPQAPGAGNPPFDKCYQDCINQCVFGKHAGRDSDARAVHFTC
jgi:hypothetical protein